MKAKIEKPKESKSRAVAHSVVQKKSNAKQGSGFVDNRSEAVTQRKMTEIVDNNTHVKQLSGIYQMQSTIQLNGNIAQYPTIESISEAFPILGQRLQTEYQKIDHGLTADSDLIELMKTYKARLAVMKYFRKALLANGLNGASKIANQRFKTGEAGHIQAIMQLRTLIQTNHEDIEPGDEDYVKSELNKVKMTRQQIK